MDKQKIAFASLKNQYELTSIDTHIDDKLANNEITTPELMGIVSFMFVQKLAPKNTKQTHSIRPTFNNFFCKKCNINLSVPLDGNYFVLRK